jgi:hypothetical protein
MEVDGHPLPRPEDTAAVVRCLHEVTWSPFPRRTLSRAVPLVLTLLDGASREYEVQRSLNDPGARIHFPRESAYAFSPTLPEVLSRAGAPLP